MIDEPVDDEDNPEWTAEDFRLARPANEVHGERFAAMLMRPVHPVPISDEEFERMLAERDMVRQKRA